MGNLRASYLLWSSAVIHNLSSANQQGDQRLLNLYERVQDDIRNQESGTTLEANGRPDKRPSSLLDPARICSTTEIAVIPSRRMFFHACTEVSAMQT